MNYRHTQIGWVTIVTLGMVGVLMAATSLGGGEPIPGIVFLGLVLILFLFSSLTVRVEQRSLIVSFGPGLIRRTIDLGDVRDVQVVQNSWLQGWGIRRFGAGWMWNVSGLGAVELEYKSGGRFRIGTDEPEKLAAAIRQKLDRQR